MLCAGEAPENTDKYTGKLPLAGRLVEQLERDATPTLVQAFERWDQRVECRLTQHPKHRFGGLCALSTPANAATSADTDDESNSVRAPSSAR